jgi:L,D-peptidoglycan transpeptidase YkuD (ErfK/YbiS/YcfS/YnhG family)
VGLAVRGLAVALLLTGCASPVEEDAPPSPHATPEPSSYAESPAWADALPERTRQVVRTVSSDRWCDRVHCTVTEAWERDGDGWRMVRDLPSTIGPSGWGKERRDDGRTPEGVFRIKVTFSTTPHNPGRMPWRRRLPTSNVTDEEGPLYNTWIEEPWRTDGDRPSMRWGLVVDYNHVRLEPGVGRRPVPAGGSGIFLHTSRPGRLFEPSDGCTRVSRPAHMRWLLTWLRPGAHPRIVQNL